MSEGDAILIPNQSMQLEHALSYLPKNLGCNMQFHHSTPAGESAVCVLSSGFCLAQCLLALAMVKASA